MEKVGEKEVRRVFGPGGVLGEADGGWDAVGGKDEGESNVEGRRKQDGAMLK